MRLQHPRGAWPAGFDDLIKAKLLKEIPLDPYTGKPLLWKRTPTGLIIYSVGFDKFDVVRALRRLSARRSRTARGPW